MPIIMDYQYKEKYSELDNHQLNPIKSQPFDLELFKNYTQLKNYNTTS